MPFYLNYIFSVFSQIPFIHWVVIGALSALLTISRLIREKTSVYSAIALGTATIVGLIILEMTVVVRFTGIMPHGYGFDFWSGFHRLFYGGEQGRREIITNIIVFVPFGFFLKTSWHLAPDWLCDSYNICFFTKYRESSIDSPCWLF